MNHWIRPSCDSRTGASHLRRGAPCQDACGSVGFRDAAGTPIQVLVVSDGHGGVRYARSDVGARLACTVAMRELEQALAPARVAHPGALQDWRDWLALELPARIVAAWLQAVERHWRTDPHAEGAGFSPVLYGATLGVLVLTPHWWAHTGLGDWDLVRIEADGAEGAAGEMAGGEALLSEEPDCEGGGEATFSLCLDGAGRHFASRTALHPLTSDDSPFALLLATDGLRKSCGSDADFLTLCRYLAGLPAEDAEAGGHELAQALDHISGQGSGDDISVAVARWAPAQQGAAWPPLTDRPPARLVQPLPGSASDAPQPAAERAGARPAAMAGALDPLLETPTPAVEPAVPVRSSHAGRWLVLVVAGLVLGGAALSIRLGRGPGLLVVSPQPSPRVLTLQQRSDLRRLVQDLCQAPAGQPTAQERAGGRLAPGMGSSRSRDPDRAGAQPVAPPSTATPSAASADAAPHSPAGSASTLPATRSTATLPGAITEPARDAQRQQRIAATLATRASVFQRLRDGDPVQVAALLAASHVDPLSALIAASASDVSLRPAAFPVDPPGPLQQLGRRLTALLPWEEPSRRRSAAPSPLAALGACPELHQALRASWQRLEAAAASPSPRAAPLAGPPVRSPATKTRLPGPAPGVSGPPARSAASSP